MDLQPDRHVPGSPTSVRAVRLGPMSTQPSNAGWQWASELEQGLYSPNGAATADSTAATVTAQELHSPFAIAEAAKQFVGNPLAEAWQAVTTQRFKP